MEAQGRDGTGYCTALREGSLTARVASIYLGCEGERCVADCPLLATRRLLDDREAEDEVCCHAEEEQSPITAQRILHRPLLLSTLINTLARYVFHQN